ncbi:MAG: low molecular weight protein-tyrosine-phosphatase [Erysipelotrichaceae bacterium]
MRKVLFVCHGNICRSPMAEFMLKEMAKQQGLDLEISSCAVSNEEIGRDIHPGTKHILDLHHIPYQKRNAYRISEQAYQYYDDILCMDVDNLRRLEHLLNTSDKAKLLLSYANEKRSIKDPWYTGNFEETYQDILLGLNGFIKSLKEEVK